MNLRFKSQLPWALSFSFARAIQQPALEIWRGQDANVKAARKPCCIAPDAIAPRAEATTPPRWKECK
jgi:fructose-bisphosphate aldolase class 1